MDIQKIIDTHTYQEIAEAAGISPSLAKKWKTGEKDWRGSSFEKVNQLKERLGGTDMEKMISDEYLERFEGSPAIAKILEDDETQRDIAKALRIAQGNINAAIDDQVEDLLPSMFLDGLTKFGKNYQFWFDNQDKWFGAPMDYLAKIIDTGDYSGFLAKHFPDWNK